MSIERRRTSENARQQQAIQQLLNVLKTESGTIIENFPSKQHHSYLLFEEIYLAFEPLVISLTKRKISGLPYTISSMEYQDIIARQKMILWEIIRSFRWNNFSSNDHVLRAFILYITKACGHLSNSHHDKNLGLKSELPMLRNKQLRRPVEEKILSREYVLTILQCIAQWKSECSKKFVDAVLMRFRENMSVREISEHEGIEETTVKTRIARGKRALALILSSQGVSDFDESLLIKDSRAQFSNRLGLLEERRKLFKKRLPSWEHLMLSKVVAVMEVFYGLNGCEPLFDYSKTAEKLGITKGLVGVYLSQGNRILLETEQLPPRRIQKNYEKNLYSYWRRNQSQMGLSPDYERVLTMIFEEGRPLREIAIKLGLSQITISRIKRRCLERIVQVSDSKIKAF